MKKLLLITLLLFVSSSLRKVKAAPSGNITSNIFPFEILTDKQLKGKTLNVSYELQNKASERYYNALVKLTLEFEATPSLVTIKYLAKEEVKASFVPRDILKNKETRETELTQLQDLGFKRYETVFTVDTGNVKLELSFQTLVEELENYSPKVINLVYKKTEILFSSIKYQVIAPPNYNYKVLESHQSFQMNEDKIWQFTANEDTDFSLMLSTVKHPVLLREISKLARIVLFIVIPTVLTLGMTAVITLLIIYKVRKVKQNGRDKN